MKLYQILAQTLEWEPPAGEWSDKRQERLDSIMAEMPSGSGWDLGTKLGDYSKSKIVLHGAFHHMNGDGYYDGWTEHNIVIRPSLSHGFELTVTGRDRNGIKDYLAEMFQDVLSREWEESN